METVVDLMNQTEAAPVAAASLASNIPFSTAIFSWADIWKQIQQLEPAHYDGELQLPVEEVFNTITHGIGFLLSIIGTISMYFLIVRHNKSSNTHYHLWGCLIYCLSLMSVYCFSTIYHSCGIWGEEEKKQYYKRLDHCAIYLLIAGTYTPFTLVHLIYHNKIDKDTNPHAAQIYKSGIRTLVFVWTLGSLGMFVKYTGIPVPEPISNSFYLFLGWFTSIFAKPMFRCIPKVGLHLLVVGGLCFSFGMCFLVWESLPFNHAIWHTMVVCASVFHYFSVMISIVLHEHAGSSHLHNNIKQE